MRYRVIIGVAIAASLCGGVSFAQNPPTNAPPPSAPAPNPTAPNSQPQTPSPQNGLSDAANALVGTWEFSNADHDKICHFNFRTDAVTGGYRLDIDKNCPTLFPSTKDMTGWAIDNYGSLRLIDARGNSVVELTEVENGMYDGFTPEEGRYILQSAAAAPMRSADDMVGDWTVARGGGKPNCALTLSRSPAGPDALALKIKPGCGNTLVTRFNPVAWRMEEGELVLLSPRGESWQFEETDANSWQRVPESSDPVLLVRP
jgi:Protease inhibitor Inh